MTQMGLTEAFEVLLSSPAAKHRDTMVLLISAIRTGSGPVPAVLDPVQEEELHLGCGGRD